MADTLHASDRAASSHLMMFVIAGTVYLRNCTWFPQAQARRALSRAQWRGRKNLI